ncbi:hypothetical protein NJD71_04080 [Psychrobacter sp. PP-21]|uniref:hypothetical protein n=1 Tax=Psychrobacter sp. PP-21 TaxID=2957503 RepID=UPI0029BBFCF5|nr:hypothetical protein [Psychrobacter sp. PP-21]MDX2373304.1 hypothetical protein [Psychrobacter sp. PP-21]
MKYNVLTAAILSSGFAFFASSANAAMVTDGHGNVGYDSYEECVTAVRDGSAKFYTPYTYQNPKRQAGEATVGKMRLSEVMIPQSVVNNNNLPTSNYSAGACDLGVGQANGRYGVSGDLVGKYIPIAADMPVNVYMDSAGNPVRLSMQQCDNHFGGKFPTPIVGEVAAPEAQLAIAEARSVEPVMIETTRVIRPTSYRVKEVILVPENQVKSINTARGDAIAIENSANDTVIVGKKADADVINNIAVTQSYPVIDLSDDADSDNQQRSMNSDDTEYMIIE